MTVCNAKSEYQVLIFDQAHILWSFDADASLQNLPGWVKGQNGAR